MSNDAPTFDAEGCIHQLRKEIGLVALRVTVLERMHDRERTQAMLASPLQQLHEDERAAAELDAVVREGRAIRKEFETRLQCPETHEPLPRVVRDFDELRKGDRVRLAIEPPGRGVELVLSCLKEDTGGGMCWHPTGPAGWVVRRPAVAAGRVTMLGRAEEPADETDSFPGPMETIERLTDERNDLRRQLEDLQCQYRGALDNIRGLRAERAELLKRAAEARVALEGGHGE